jgi:hypothetical protein
VSRNFSSVIVAILKSLPRDLRLYSASGYSR